MVLELAAAFAAVCIAAVSGTPAPTSTPSACPVSWPSQVQAVPACCPAQSNQKEYVCINGINGCTAAEWRDEKSAMTALLLAIFLGGTGASYFYYGYTGLGAGLLCMQLAPCICICVAMCCLGAALGAGGGAASSAAGAASGSGNGAEVDMDSSSASESGTGSGKGAGKGAEMEAGALMPLIQCFACLMFCGQFVWQIIVIVGVAGYDLYPQQSGACLKKM